MLVATYEYENEYEKGRPNGDGWQILSAQGKKIGDAVLIGDKIHLRNMNPAAGYLDSYEWVHLLSPFSHYPDGNKSNGVFTSSDNGRWSGPSSTWTIESPDKENEAELIGLDKIRLSNGFRSAESAFYLHTYPESGETVSDYPDFSNYAGYKKFVFTKNDASFVEHDVDQSGVWIVEPVKEPETDSTYFVRGEFGEKWLDLGVFKFSDTTPPKIVALSINSPDNGHSLMGHVGYEGETFTHVRARSSASQADINTYKIKHFASDEESAEDVEKKIHLDGEWSLGGRRDKKITGIDIASIDQGLTLSGTITFQDEAPIKCKAVRAGSKLFQTQRGNTPEQQN